MTDKTEHVTNEDTPTPEESVTIKCKIDSKGILHTSIEAEMPSVYDLQEIKDCLRSILSNRVSDATNEEQE